MGKNSQLFQKRKAATRRDLQRKAARIRPNTRVLIVCEGAKTETIYFERFVERLGLVAVDVDICGEGEAPISVVNHAERRVRAEGNPDDAGYNAVFCVFDRDSHDSFEAAKSRYLQLVKEGVLPPVSETAVVSIPSFEYWFRLHFGYVRAPFMAAGGKSPGGMVVADLRTINGFENYEKNLSAEQFEMLAARTDDAVENAELANADATATGEPNPSTMVHCVIGYLRSLQETK